MLTVTQAEYVQLNMKGILILKRWRSGISLARPKRRKHLRQLELNLWPKRHQNSSSKSSRPFANVQNTR